MDSSFLVAPLLENLSLSECEHQSHTNFLFPPSPFPPNTSNLDTLILGDTLSLPDWNELAFLEDLKSTPSLVVLSVENATITDSFIDGFQGDEDEYRPFLCPLLERMDLGDSEFSWTAVQRMISGRWVEYGEGTEVLTMETINFRRRNGFFIRNLEDAEALRGLKEEVEVVNCWEEKGRYLWGCQRVLGCSVRFILAFAVDVSCSVRW